MIPVIYDIQVRNEKLWRKFPLFKNSPSGYFNAFPASFICM